MDRFLFLSLDGLSRGAVYAAFALALVLIWRGTRVVNFAQGAMAVATVYLAYSVSSATGSYWLGFASALVGAALLGAVVEVVVARRVHDAPPLNAIVVAIGLVLLMQAVLGMVYTNEYLAFPAPFSQTAVVFGVSPYDLFVFAVVGVLLVLLTVLFTRTPLGLRMRASAFAPEVSRLLGVDVALMRTLGWVLAAVVGSLAGLLVIPTELGLHPTAMDDIFVAAFTAAVVGGLDSPLGAVVGGLIVGVLLSWVGGYVRSDATPLAVLVLLVGVLLVRPGGLFAAPRARKV
ncbi:branched-chain amino acid ABC transporter permease [Cryptosporangium phraense]|uniref:Branched-chain amino acid ABC transporter permease n=1 Tax=Cryptosporangium phraense TaxID=2593070 RepID=A0A545AG60_9ACTN|nr:branched-chain amino acid ABC transporter permease [Cryptosporangium phraense]TQS40250.1 branched-chain amino acid ABC transporter permease [Cryptosporangium phraense]